MKYHIKLTSQYLREAIPGLNNLPDAERDQLIHEHYKRLREGIAKAKYIFTVDDGMTIIPIDDNPTKLKVIRSLGLAFKN